MDVMTYKNYVAHTKYSADDVFVGHIAAMGDVVGFHGESAEELRAVVEEAVSDHLDNG
ncbi:type II toxin-antitoxin system HicB family antitoxin [Pseudomonas sp. EL_65y_Pfl2_R95]|uniref:type II toxin-antitoxin system HicB family antitoxin n=1 Tax=Pseudomonas sp. EL_65y_Pfl2_R95 TaxID=3088698 RepID=UPI0030D75C23